MLVHWPHLGIARRFRHFKSVFPILGADGRWEPVARHAERQYPVCNRGSRPRRSAWRGLACAFDREGFRPLFFRAHVTFANDASGWRGARFLGNGAEFGRIRRPSAGASANTELVISELVWINVGELVRVQGAHAAGAALAVPLSDCTFTGTLISRNPY